MEQEKTTQATGIPKTLNPSSRKTHRYIVHVQDHGEWSATILIEAENFKTLIKDLKKMCKEMEIDFSNILEIPEEMEIRSLKDLNMIEDDLD